MQTIEEHHLMQGIMYGGQSTEGHLGDAWLLDSGTMTWQQTATTDFGGFSDAAKAWHAAAVLKCTDVRLSMPPDARVSKAVAAYSAECVCMYCTPEFKSFGHCWESSSAVLRPIFRHMDPQQGCCMG